MSEVMDTGKWSYRQLLQWKIEKNQQKTKQCNLCHGVGVVGDMVIVERREVPSKYAGYYHQKCADEIKSEYTKTCISCGNVFVMRYETSREEVCSDCMKRSHKRLLKNLQYQLGQARMRGLPAN